MTPKQRRALNREAWPPNLQHLTGRDVAHEAPSHPTQLAYNRKHANKARAYWEIHGPRHADEP